MSGGGRQRRRGLLTVLLAFFVGSAVLRLGGEVDMARAFEADDVDPGATVTDDAGAPPTELVAAIQRREARVSEREAALEERARALAIAETQVVAMTRSLEQAERSLTDTLAVADDASEQDLASLTAVYENMAPAEAAALFEQMVPEFAAGFLARMRPESAAGVMANLQPETAHEVSVVLAGRNARVPRN